MGIRPDFNINDLNKYIEQQVEQQEQNIIRVMRFAGEKAVNEARTNGAYQDRTANLRNSTGYVIVRNGSVLNEDFSSSATGTEVSELDGRKIGKELAYELAANYPDLALIVVAGMNYAAYVESKGFNVLTSAEQMANSILPNLLSKIK